MGRRCLVQRNAGTARPSAYSGQGRHLVRECEIFSLMWHASGRGSQSKQSPRTAWPKLHSSNQKWLRGRRSFVGCPEVGPRHVPGCRRLLVALSAVRVLISSPPILGGHAVAGKESTSLSVLTDLLVWPCELPVLVRNSGGACDPEDCRRLAPGHGGAFSVAARCNRLPGVGLSSGVYKGHGVSGWIYENRSGPARCSGRSRSSKPGKPPDSPSAHPDWVRSLTRVGPTDPGVELPVLPLRVVGSGPT